MAVVVRQTGSLTKIAKSAALGDALEAIARPVYEAAAKDPNQEYVDSLDMHRFVSGGDEGRVSVQIGAHPVIGSRVEAKRGTLARALGLIG